jgi:hypothetical protein
MKKTRLFARTLVLATAATLVSCASSQGASSAADGAWDFKMTSPFGELAASVSMQAVGGQLSGTFDLGGGRVWPIENGMIADNQFSFSLTRDGSPMVYEMSGTVDGSTVSGMAKAMGMEAPWAMTRKQ